MPSDAPAPAPFRSTKMLMDDFRVPMPVWLKLKGVAGSSVSTRVNEVASQVLEDWAAGKLIPTELVAAAAPVDIAPVAPPKQKSRRKRA